MKTREQTYPIPPIASIVAVRFADKIIHGDCRFAPGARRVRRELCVDERRGRCGYGVQIEVVDID